MLRDAPGVSGAARVLFFAAPQIKDHAHEMCEGLCTHFLHDAGAVDFDGALAHTEIAGHHVDLELFACDTEHGWAVGQPSNPAAKRVLIRHAPAPLLLTRGGPWAPSPRFVIAADFGVPTGPTRTNLRVLARRLCTECHGWLAELEGAEAQDPNSLAADTVRMGSDILAVAAPTATSWAHPASPFERLLGLVSCDLLVMPDAGSGSTVDAFPVALRTKPADGQPAKP